MDLRELVNTPNQTANLTGPLKPRQSLVDRSAGAEMCKMSGSKDPSAVLCWIRFKIALVVEAAMWSFSTS